MDTTGDGNMNSIEQVVQEYLVRNYGDLITAEKPQYDKVTGTYHVELKSIYPRIVRDEKDPQTTIVRFLNLRELGKVELSRGLKVVEATSAADCGTALSERLDLWRQQAEQILVIASADVFARIAEGIHVLNPLKLVIDELTERKADEAKIPDFLVEKHDKPARLRKYLDLLASLQILKRVEDGYAYDNMFAVLAEQTGNDRKKLRIALISHVIRRKYSTLRQVFGITQLEPYIHVDNCYYWSALDAEKLVSTTKSKLFNKYIINYGKISPWSFESILKDLEEQSALNEENGYIRGSESYLEKMIELKRGTQQLNPPKV
ncbi:MAG: hypothetical protein JRN39_07920 [Nitrososphaerota archaeon]|nr:hypothetical protein [Nitrososphaerota archaeon]